MAISSPLIGKLLPQTLSMIDADLFKDDDRECPECGSLLVLRNNKNNGRQFYGCRAYPQCGFTEPIYDEDEDHTIDSLSIY